MSDVRRTLSLAAVAALLAALGVTACSGGDDPTPPTVATLTVLQPVGGAISDTVGRSVAVRVAARTADGRAVPGARVTFSASAGTIAPLIAAGDASGVADATWTLGPNAGTQTLTLSSGSATTTIVATALPKLAALTVAGFPNAKLAPGGSFPLTGTGFTSTTQVFIAGAQVPVSVTSSTQLTVGTPAVGAVPCAPVANVPIVVRRTSGAQVDSVVGAVAYDPAQSLALQPGARAIADTSGGVQCLRLENAGAYVVSLYNTATVVPGGIALQLRGRAGGTILAARAPSAVALPSIARKPIAPDPTAAAHTAWLERERAMVRALGAPRIRDAGTSVRAAPPVVGDVIGVNAMFFDCASTKALQGRVAAAGTNAIVVEDVAAVGASTRDATYRTIATEFDATMYPLVRQYFGDPLAMNATFGVDPRVRIVITPYVTDSVPNTIGFVSGCNFYPRAQVAGSNQSAVFYARPPLAGETTAEWLRQLRATLVHETKHLAAYAERFARAGTGTPVLEEPWLEEATARAAEELYARTFSGATWKGNATFASTVGCELTSCDARPIAMSKHFAALGDFYSRVDSLTPLGPTSRLDGSYYGSGWLLVRWAADRFAIDEPSFFKALTVETTATGITNLALRTGRSIDRMLPDWALSLALDDRPGFTTSLPELTIPSWNTRDVFRGLNQLNPFGFPRPFPLLERTVTAGDFTVDVPLLRSYTSAFVELTLPSTGGQLLSLVGPNGTARPATAGMAIVRVQ